MSCDDLVSGCDLTDFHLYLPLVICSVEKSTEKRKKILTHLFASTSSITGENHRRKIISETLKRSERGEIKRSAGPDPGFRSLERHTPARQRSPPDHAAPPVAPPSEKQLELSDNLIRLYLVLAKTPPPRAPQSPNLPLVSPQPALLLIDVSACFMSLRDTTASEENLIPIGRRRQ